jgi:transposase
MRQDHPAGDKVFVDYSGKKIMIVDRATGVVREAEIFVAVLGASNYTYAEATWTQKLADWIEAHVRMFRFFGGVPRLVVPDNLKSGVHRASFYDPEINRSYGMMASHYGVGILPARPRKPRDKAKVEAGVRFAQTYILGRLRRQTFFSLAEANAAMPRWSASTRTSCAGLASAADICSRPSRCLSWRRCRMPTISSRNGSWPASRSIITSRSTASSTHTNGLKD